MRSEDSQSEAFSELRPPTPAERAFDEYLDRVGTEGFDTTSFIAQQSPSWRMELESLIEDWGGLRQRFGEEELLEGSEFDGYRIEGLLGRGGMGSVYAAVEIASEREVALKVLSREHRYSDEAWARFEREAQLAARINHPACVFVYGVASIKGRPAIAMERMSGRNLQDRLTEEGPIRTAEAVQAILQVCAGLRAAHEIGILHRDVKPANCFFAEDGSLKIGDFGISRCLEPGDDLTASGQFLGSPLYAAPEQLRGQAVDERTDVYATAATLFSLLTGKPPYEGKGLGDVIAKVISDPIPSVREHSTLISRDLDRVIQRNLSKAPRDRAKNITELVEALEPFLSGRQKRRSRQGVAKHFDGRLWNRLLRLVERVLDDNSPDFQLVDTEFSDPWREGKPIGNYQSLGDIGPTEAGVFVLAHDPELNRRVWIHVYSEGYVPEPPQLGGPPLLRWIEDGRDHEMRWRVFEDPGGTRLRTYAIRKLPIPWPRLRTNLIRLCENLESPQPVKRTEQLWVDRLGYLRILEHTQSRLDTHNKPRARILEEVAQDFLLDKATKKLRPGYCLALERIQQRLIGQIEPFDDVSVAKRMLEAQGDRPSGLTRAQRLVPAAISLVAVLVLLSIELVRRFGLSSIEPEEFGLLALRVAGFSALTLTLLSFCLRGSLWSSLCGLEVRSMSGGRAARWRCAWRTIAIWALPLYFMTIAHPWSNPATQVLFVLASFSLSGALILGGFPARSIGDVSAKTCVVRS